MPTFTLKVTAETENVQSLTVPEDFCWHLKLKCSNCGEETSNFVEVDPSNEEDIPGGRGTANLVYTCKLCKRKSSLIVDKKSIQTVTNFESMSPLVTFDCRGIEPVDWQPTDGFVVVSTSETEFNDVDLSDDFVDFDEKAGESISLMELKWSFE